MDENQRKAVQKLRRLLIETLQIDEIILKLRAEGILTADSTEVLERAVTKSERCIKLLEIIINLDKSWKPFLNALDNINQQSLRVELESEAYGIPTHEFKQNLVPQLEDYIRHEIENIRRFWQDYLKVADLNKTYQPLEIVEIKERNAQKENIEGYNFIWENPSRHLFVFEGDPGVGKTTWMSILAMDWANKTSQLIRKQVDLLFLVPLRHLKSTTFEGLLQYLSEVFEQFDIRKIAKCLKHPRTLILLDGFDENPSCIEFIKTFTIKNGYRSKVVITCRGSHFYQIRESQICDMRLIVKGFKEDAINKFFESQNCETSNQLFTSYSHLPEMCKVPMIAAILCSICKYDGVSKVIAEDENCSLLNIFASFVEMLLNMQSEKRSNLIIRTNDLKRVMEAVGRFALATVKNNSASFWNRL